MDVAVTPGGAQKQSLVQALSEAFGHRSYVLLVLGFFTCGFQLLFITVHLPAYLVDRGLSVDAGAWTIGVIGLFNIFGSIAAGWLGDKMPKRYLLSVIYLAALAGRCSLYLASRHVSFGGRFRRVDGPALAFDRAADVRRWSR